MTRLRSLCLAGATMAAWARAQEIRASNTSVPDDGAITLVTALENDMVPLAPVLPLTNAASEKLPPTGLIGSVFLVNSTSTFEVTSRDLAAIDCDLIPGELQSDYMLDQAVAANASAVLFYSLSSETCMMKDDTGIYPWIYSMRSKSDSQRLFQAVQTSFEQRQQLWAQIALTKDVQGDNGNGTFGTSDLGSHAGQDGDDHNSNEEQSPLGPSPTTAVAMIILYSITGIITALFLVIIVTGAVRAHRHPERYGPRNVIGRPRQSRAKGIARAMLDTLPIVKFGQHDEAPKSTDVELGEDGSHNRRASADPSHRAANETSTPQPTNTEPSTDLNSAPRRQSTNDEGIAAAVTGAGKRSSQTPHPDTLGCSICTEDFEPGQDQRVLPCDHRFHPDCVDPWLLNVSGTCPLCRIDLHPPTDADGEGEVDEQGNPVRREVGEDGLPLPLNAAEGAGQAQRMSIRRSLLIGLIGSRSLERMSREERLATLRQLRARQRREREAGASAGAGDGAGATGHAGAEGVRDGAGEARGEQEDEGRIRSRLRRVLGVRTRRTAAGPATATTTGPTPQERDEDEQQQQQR